MLILQKSVNQYPGIVVIGTGRYKLFNSLHTGGLNRWTFYQENLDTAPEYTIVFCTLPDVDGFIELKSGEIEPLRPTTAKEQIKTVYIPLASPLLPKEFRYILPPEMADNEKIDETCARPYKLLLVEDYPWGQLGNSAYLEYLLNIYRINGQAISATVGLLKGNRRFGATDISGEKTALENTGEKYWQRLGLEVSLIDLNNPQMPFLALFFQNKTGFSREVIETYTLQITLRRQRFRTQFDIEWQTIELILKSIKFNNVFRYEQQMKKTPFLTLWEKKCDDFLSVNIYPRVNTLLEDYSGFLTDRDEIENFIFNLRNHFALSLSSIDTCALTLPNDEIDYRIMSKETQKNFISHINNFVEKKLKNETKLFIERKFQKWFGELERNGVKAINE